MNFTKYLIYPKPNQESKHTEDKNINNNFVLQTNLNKKKHKLKFTSPSNKRYIQSQKDENKVHLYTSTDIRNQKNHKKKIESTQNSIIPSPKKFSSYKIIEKDEMDQLKKTKNDINISNKKQKHHVRQCITTLCTYPEIKESPNEIKKNNISDSKEIKDCTLTYDESNKTNLDQSIVIFIKKRQDQNKKENQNINNTLSITSNNHQNTSKYFYLNNKKIKKSQRNLPKPAKNNLNTPTNITNNIYSNSNLNANSILDDQENKSKFYNPIPSEIDNLSFKFLPQVQVTRKISALNSSIEFNNPLTQFSCTNNANFVRTVKRRTTLNLKNHINYDKMMSINRNSSLKNKKSNKDVTKHLKSNGDLNSNVNENIFIIDQTGNNHIFFDNDKENEAKNISEEANDIDSCSSISEVSWGNSNKINISRILDEDGHSKNNGVNINNVNNINSLNLNNLNNTTSFNNSVFNSGNSTYRRRQSENNGSNNNNKLNSFFKSENNLSNKFSMINKKSKETETDEHSEINIIYHAEPINTINDLYIKSDTKLEEDCKKYNKLLNKFLFQSNISQNQNNLHNNNQSQNEPFVNNDKETIYYDSNDLDKKMDKDYKLISFTKEKMKNLMDYYQNEIKRLEFELGKTNLNTSITYGYGSNNYNSLLNKSISYSNTQFNNYGISTSNNISLKRDGLDPYDYDQMNKEENYKKTITNLLNELRSVTNEKINEAFLNEINDFLNDKNDPKNSNAHKNMRSGSNKKYGKRDSNQNLTALNISFFLSELENFKKEEHLHTFEIPIKYRMSDYFECIREKLVKNKIVRVYKNYVIEVIDKKKTIRRVFPDGYEIWYYKNKDIQQKFPNGKICFYYNKNKSCEFRYLKEKYLVYRFPSGQYEKHYFDNSIYIKFTDGSYRITRCTGEELIQFPNGKIQIKDKKGNIYYNGDLNKNQCKEDEGFEKN